LFAPLLHVQRYEVGAGYVSLKQVDHFLTSVLPSTFAFLFCFTVCLAQYLKISETLDPELGPLWDAEKAEYTRTYFYYGFQISMARLL
jgi:nucleoside recognition membrane protein YjiH